MTVAPSIRTFAVSHGLTTKEVDMATTRAKSGVTWLGSPGSGRWLVVGIVIAALLAGLILTMIRGGEPTDLSGDNSYTIVKLSHVETLDRAVLTETARIGYTEFKLNQVADLGFGSGAMDRVSDVYTRFKLDQVRGDQVNAPVPNNLIE